ncbi:hypothetical protein TNCT_284591, partial [Trichonephila clavata]
FRRKHVRHSLEAAVAKASGFQPDWKCSPGGFSPPPSHTSRIVSNNSRNDALSTKEPVFNVTHRSNTSPVMNQDQRIESKH